MSNYPKIQLNIAHNSTELLIYQTEENSRPVLLTNHSFNDFAKHLSKLTNISNIFQAAEDGDELFHEFELKELNDELLDYDYLIESFSKIQKRYFADLDSTYPDELLAELRNNINLDLIASVYDALITIVVSQIIIQAQELLISKASISGDTKELQRFLKILNRELNEYKIEFVE